MAKDRSDDSMGAQNDQTPLKLADTLPEEKREAALQLAEKLDLGTCKALFCLVHRRRRIFWNFPTR